ncbi:hypothetical protein CROQUDRAFT_94146 [Cronartium quercuum f. sp. fusiforme G11]|uniref:Uncharacterized protein n=1 Tax=Cronartium quercuum f. sp. fusiforme G11 TaxID=708437 RepID=A0A9P6NFM4_9BASI|nr:hypothetical protein CROQUDRAFT_94146 [Cronartium quercuum f. sp. fusiforme G11]
MYVRVDVRVQVRARGPINVTSTLTVWQVRTALVSHFVDAWKQKFATPKAVSQRSSATAYCNRFWNTSLHWVPHCLRGAIG